MSYKILDLIQGSPEWHTWRKGKIGASMIASVMGLNPFETPLQIYYRIMDDLQVEENEAMRLGKELEVVARQRYNEKHGVNFQPICIESLEFPWMIASLDGFLDGKAIEIKCGEKTHKIAQFGEIPPYYYPQLQWIMHIVGLNEMIYISFYNDEMIEIPVKRDAMFVEKMVECVKLFYIRLQEFDPPPAGDKDYTCIEDREAVESAYEYKRLCAEIESLEKLKEMKRLELIERSGKRNVKIGPLKVTRIVSKGRVDYKGAATASGINLEPFRGQQMESWRIA